MRFCNAGAISESERTPQEHPDEGAAVSIPSLEIGLEVSGIDVVDGNQNAGPAIYAREESHFVELREKGKEEKRRVCEISIS